MGLITKEVEVISDGKNMNWYRNKGYEVPQIFDKAGILRTPKGTRILVKVEDLTHSSGVQVDVECDSCGKLLHISWNTYIKFSKEDGSYYCHKCAITLDENEVKNIINRKLPNWTIIKTYTVEGKTYVDLLDMDGYIYNNMYIQDIRKGHKTYPWWPSYENSIQNINHYCVINKLTIKCISNEYIDGINNLNWECLNCHSIFQRSRSSIMQGTVGCPHCGDGISYPNKYMRSVLKQLKEQYRICDYYPEYTIKDKKKRYIYDNYVYLPNNKTCIIEVHGEQHYKETLNSRWLIKTNFKQIQINDQKKRELGKLYTNNYFEINASISDKKYIKNSILNSEFANICDLNQINWDECHKAACKNMVNEVCNLWNSGIQSTKQISAILKICQYTVSTYLKQGVELGLCKYDPKEVIRKVRKSEGTPVVQLDINGEYIHEYESGAEASRQTGVNASDIASCCRGEKKKAGGFKWMRKVS